MKTVHRMVLKSYLGPMILTFLIVMFILLMNFMWLYIDELVGKGLDAMVILELLGYALVTLIPLAIPLAMLLAAIMTMGNLGENYELLALKSAGMSLTQIIKPIVYVVIAIAIGSFFIANNLVPLATQKMYSTLSDIRQQKQVLEFQDGLFFNGIDNMSIRVDTQDPKSKLLRNVLIYDNRKSNGDMTTTIADSGYIRLSDDKRFLRITLYNGETYEQTRSNKWYTESELRHNIFTRQDATIEIEGFAMDERSDASSFSNSKTKRISELQRDIDSLDNYVNNTTVKAYDPLLREQLFVNHPTFMDSSDSLYVDKSKMAVISVLDSIPLLSQREKSKIWEKALTQARSSRSAFTFDEAGIKSGLNQLYRSRVEWHKKFSLSISIIIFFLIGAPLGAIIRKGGLGMPVVVSVLFFVFYYVVSLTGENNAKEGNWDALYGAWISTYILTPIAVYLTIKASNDSSILDTDWYYLQFKKVGNGATAIKKRITDRLNIKSKIK